MKRASSILVAAWCAAAAFAWGERPPGALVDPAARRAATRQKNEEQIERLEKMSPDERRAALNSLPPERRERIEKRLNHLESLSPEQRARLKERLERFKTLTPEQQDQVRQMSRELQQLALDRRVVVRRELNALRRLPESDREARMQRPAWKQRFSSSEQDLLMRSSALLPLTQ